MTAYAEYLQSPHWQYVRKLALRRAGDHCQVCGRARTDHGVILDVHHNTYARRGEELESDVVVLCRECHERHHSGEGDLPSPRAPRPRPTRPRYTDYTLCTSANALELLVAAFEGSSRLEASPPWWVVPCPLCRGRREVEFARFSEGPVLILGHAPACVMEDVLRSVGLDPDVL